eukprot:g1227.t1
MASATSLFLDQSMCDADGRPQRVQLLNIVTNFHRKMCSEFRDPMIKNVIDRVDAKQRRIQNVEALIEDRKTTKREFDYYSAKVVDLKCELQDERHKYLARVTDAHDLDRMVRKNNPTLLDKLDRNMRKLNQVTNNLKRMSGTIYADFNKCNKDCMKQEFEDMFKLIRLFLKGQWVNDAQFSPSRRGSRYESRIARVAKKFPPKKTSAKKKPVMLKNQVKEIRRIISDNGSNEEMDSPPPPLPTRRVMTQVEAPKRPPRKDKASSTQTKVRESLRAAGVLSKAARSAGRHKSVRFSTRIPDRRDNKRFSTRVPDRLQDIAEKSNVRKSVRNRNKRRSARNLKSGRESVRMKSGRDPFNRQSRAIDMSKDWRKSLAIRDAAILKIQKLPSLREVASEQEISKRRSKSSLASTPTPITPKDSDTEGAGEKRADAIALYDYAATADDELSIAEDESLIVVDSESSTDWWLVKKVTGRDAGKQGLVPATYVENSVGVGTGNGADEEEVVEEEDEAWTDEELALAGNTSPVSLSEESKTTLPEAVALYDYDATESDEISVREGMLLKVLDSESSAEWTLVEIVGSFDDAFEEAVLGSKGLVPTTYLGEF